jgi:hypothetical protein
MPSIFLFERNFLLLSENVFQPRNLTQDTSYKTNKNIMPHLVVLIFSTLCDLHCIY